VVAMNQNFNILLYHSLDQTIFKNVLQNSCYNFVQISNTDDTNKYLKQQNYIILLDDKDQLCYEISQQIIKTNQNAKILFVLTIQTILAKYIKLVVVIIYSIH